MSDSKAIDVLVIVFEHLLTNLEFRWVTVSPNQPTRWPFDQMTNDHVHLIILNIDILNKLYD